MAPRTRFRPPYLRHAGPESARKGRVSYWELSFLRQASEDLRLRRPHSEGNCESPQFYPPLVHRIQMLSDRRVFVDSLHAEGGKGTFGQAP